MGLKKRIAAARDRIDEITRHIAMNAAELAQSKKIMEDGRSQSGRAPRGSRQVHNKFVANQKQRQKQLAEAQEALSRLEADAGGLDSDVSSALSSVDDTLDDASDLPGIMHSRSMSATPAPSPPGSLEEGDKLEGSDIGTDLKGLEIPNVQGASGETATPPSSPATGTKIPGILSEQSALLADSGTESVNVGLSQLSPRPTLPIAPTTPEATQATPPGSVDVRSTQTSESSTNITPTFTPNANDVDMVDATQEPSMEIEAVTDRIVLEKAQSEFDVEMSDGTRAIAEGEGVEINKVEDAVGEVEEADAQEAPAVPSVGVSKAPAQILPAHSDVEMTDRAAEASVMATGEGEAAISTSGSIQEGGALAETQTALKEKGVTQKAPAIPAVGASKASVGILPAHSDAEMMDGGVEASATATGEGEGETSVSTSGSTRTALKEKVETQEAPAIPAVGDSDVPVQALPSTDVEMTDGRVEASAVGGLIKNRMMLKEGDEIEEARSAPAVGEQAIAHVQPGETTAEMLDVCTAEVMVVAADRECESALPPSKEEIREAVVGDDVTGHDSVLIRMDPEEEMEQGKYLPVADSARGEEAVQSSAESVKKPSTKKKAAKVKKTKESESQKLDVGEAKGEDSDVVMKEGVAITAAQNVGGGTKKVSKKKKKAVESDDEDDRDYTEAELQKLEEDGQAEILAFVQDGTKVDRSIRRLARERQDFLPESATTSREVALHVLSTKDRCNCLYHKHSDKDYKARDKKPPVQGFWLSGVTGEVRKRNDERPPTKDHLHCGCSIEAALTYFLWWKTWTLRGPAGTVEPMSKVQFNPRARNLVLQKIQQLTGITMEDMYPEDDEHYESLQYQRRLIHVQLNYLLERLKRVNLGLGTDDYTTEDAQIFFEATKRMFTSKGGSDTE